MADISLQSFRSGLVNQILRLKHLVITATGWRRAVIAMSAGALSVLALAPFYLWPVMFLTLPVLIWLIDGPHPFEGPAKRSLTTSFTAGWLFAFGYFVAGLFWIGEAFLVEADKLGWLLPFAVTLLPAGLALFWGFAAATSSTYWKPGLSRILNLSLTLGIAEWLRGHILTGFPWNLLGYTLTSSDALMQSASLIGTYALGFWAVIVFGSPLILFTEAAWRRILSVMTVSALPLIFAATFGIYKLAQAPPPDVAGVSLRIVQPSIPQREKWLPDKQASNFRLHLDLSRTTPTGTPRSIDGITHIIWPEAAMPFRPLDHPEARSAISEMLGPSAYLLAGALRVKKDPVGGASEVYNSMIVFGPGGGPAAIYDKVHLVPFGEYLPWPWLLERLGFEDIVKMRGGFTPGQSPRPILNVPGLPLASSLICYEAIFPGEAVASGPRPAFIVTITNDGWFGNTTGPRQHLHQARVRAVEEGLPVVRAANNGISAVIDAEGRLKSTLNMNIKGTIDSPLPPSKSPPLFAQAGDWIVAIHLVVITAALLLL